jgi:hypothetical protein
VGWHGTRPVNSKSSEHESKRIMQKDTENKMGKKD